MKQCSATNGCETFVKCAVDRDTSRTIQPYIKQHNACEFVQQTCARCRSYSSHVHSWHGRFPSVCNILQHWFVSMHTYIIYSVFVKPCTRYALIFCAVGNNFVGTHIAAPHTCSGIKMWMDRRGPNMYNGQWVTYEQITCMSNDAMSIVFLINFGNKNVLEHQYQQMYQL